MLTQHGTSAEMRQGSLNPGVLFAPEFAVAIAGKNRILRQDGDILWTNDGFAVRALIDTDPDQFAVLTVVGGQVGGFFATDVGLFQLFPDSHGAVLEQVHPNLRCLTPEGGLPDGRSGALNVIPQATGVTPLRRHPSAPPPPRQYLFLVDQWYTGAVLAKLGSLDAVKLKIQMKVDLTNTIFARSGLPNIQFKTQNVYPYAGEAESGLFAKQYDEIVQFSLDPDVNRKRDQDHVHFATLWHEEGGSATWRPFGTFDRTLGFELMVEGGVLDYPHEFVHDFDGDHDEAHSLTGDCLACGATQDPVPYGRGHIDKTAQFGCIMSYFTDDNCPGFCFSAPFISSSDPSLLYKGRPTGSSMEDNARVIRENADKVFGYAR